VAPVPVTKKSFWSRFDLSDAWHFIVLYGATLISTGTITSIPKTKDALLALIPGAVSVLVHQITKQNQASQPAP
jgi:hypothetical protein